MRAATAKPREAQQSSQSSASKANKAAKHKAAKHKAAKPQREAESQRLRGNNAHLEAPTLVKIRIYEPSNTPQRCVHKSRKITTPCIAYHMHFGFAEDQHPSRTDAKQD